MLVDGGGGPVITGNVYPVKTLAVSPDSASGYTAAEIEQLFAGLDPAAVAAAGRAHNAASQTLAEIADALVQHVQVLNDSWSSAASSTAVASFKQLHDTAAGLSAASAQTGSVLTWLGETILPFYKNYKAPGNGIIGDIESLFGSNPQDTAARQVMARLNNRLVQANSGLPASVSQNLPRSGWNIGSPGTSGGGAGGVLPAGLSGGAGAGGTGSLGGGGAGGTGSLGGGGGGSLGPPPGGAGTGGTTPGPLTHLAGGPPPGGAPGGGGPGGGVPGPGGGSGGGPGTGGGAPGQPGGVTGGVPGGSFGGGPGDGGAGGGVPGEGTTGDPGGGVPGEDVPGAGGSGGPAEGFFGGSPGGGGFGAAPGEGGYGNSLRGDPFPPEEMGNGIAIGPDGMITANPPAAADEGMPGRGVAAGVDGSATDAMAGPDGMPVAGGGAGGQRERERMRDAWLPEDADVWEGQGPRGARPG